MKRAFIFANGEMTGQPVKAKVIQSSDLVIAANGGSKLCKLLGIIPDIIIGDLDSLNPVDISIYQQKKVDVIKHLIHKDETDLELALNLALKNGISDIFIIGALGGRWDLTFANVLLATHPKYSKQNIRFLDSFQALIILHGENSYKIEGIEGDTVSLIPIDGDVQNITTQGLEYPLNDETLYFGSPRGVSNKIIKSQADIVFKRGCLLLCLISKNE